MSRGTVRSAYGARAKEYTELFGTIDNTHPADQALIAAWAHGLDGKVIDAGCGPGQWTNFLHALGVDAEGVDIVPEFIESARQHYPNTAFRVGSLEQLQVPDQSLAGILAWYSQTRAPTRRSSPPAHPAPHWLPEHTVVRRD
ncbi:trans-aconitate 2-methyltransferase [Paenarthrobacter sp. RAF9]